MVFERFTDRARRVVVLAQEEARMLNHANIGTEHLLLGLLSEHENIAAKAMAECDIQIEAVRTEIEKIVGRGQELPGGHVPFTPRLKRVLDIAVREALQLGHNYLSPEHLLLALIREGEGKAVCVLHELDINPWELRKEVIKILTEQVGKPATTSRGEAPFPRPPRSRAEIEKEIVSHESALEVLRAELKQLDESNS